MGYVTIAGIIAMIWGAFQITYGLFLLPFVVIALVIFLPGEIKANRKFNKTCREGHRLIAEAKKAGFY